MQTLQDSIQYKLRTKQEQSLMLLLLYLLSTRLGSLLLFGPFYFVQHPFVAFSDLLLVTDKSRAIQLHLQQSIWSPKRRIFNAFKRLIFGLAFSYVAEESSNGPSNNAASSTTDATTGTNPFWKAMQYRGPPQQWTTITNRDSNETNAQTLDGSERIEQAMKKLENLNNHLLQTNSSKTSNPISPTFDGNVHPPCKALECDVVIVGSGCGGCVAAFELANAGFDVIVVEQGKYIPPSKLTNLEVQAMDQMYDCHSLLTTEDGNIVILAGATLGGGSSINWSCCLPLPPHVQHEWATEHGLEQFQNDGAFSASMKHMMTLMTNNETASVQHNAMNRLLQKGCDALGYQWETTGQNLENTADPAAGYIGFGDRYGNKRSASITFLNPAVGQYHARILEQCYVEKVLTQRNSTINDSRRLRAIGVRCSMASASSSAHETMSVDIRSRKGVIVAAGALHSPCLLMRSGLQNRNIGRNLRLHPVTVALGRFEQPVDFYMGAPMTTVCNQFEMGPSRNGYGCKIECPCAHTGLTAVAMPFTTPEHIKERMLHFPYFVPLIVLQRDGGEGGRVRCHPENGRPMIDYTVNASDKQSMLEGVKGVVQILANAGAEEIGTCHYKDFGWRLNSTTADDSLSLSEYLDSISQRGMGLHDFGVFSAHQMGTCRLSASPAKGVVDPNGETWECSELYVMDASTFPTASGANPMMTVLSISHMLSTRLASKFVLEKNAQVTSGSETHFKIE